MNIGEDVSVVVWCVKRDGSVCLLADEEGVRGVDEEDAEEEEEVNDGKCCEVRVGGRTTHGPVMVKMLFVL